MEAVTLSVGFIKCTAVREKYFFILLWSCTQAPGDQWHGSQSLSAVPSGPFNILPCIISDAVANINFPLECISLIVTGKKLLKKQFFRSLGHGSLGVRSGWICFHMLCENRALIIKAQLKHTYFTCSSGFLGPLQNHLFHILRKFRLRNYRLQNIFTNVKEHITS